MILSVVVVVVVDDVVVAVVLTHINRSRSKKFETS